MPSQYNWNRRWILPGTREDQETNLSALAQRWFSVSRQSTTNSFALDDLANIPVIILLGEPGIGKSSEIAFYFHRSSEVIAQHIWKLQEYPPIDFNRFFNQRELWINKILQTRKLSKVKRWLLGLMGVSNQARNEVDQEINRAAMT